MRAFKYRRNFNFFLKKRSWDRFRYYRQPQDREILPSGYSINQAWGALHKNWIGYFIALHKGQFYRKIKYAKRIQDLQRDLGLPINDFECLH